MEAASPANKSEHLKSETLQMSHWETSDRAGRLVESSQGLNVESFVVARGGASVS